MDYYSAIKKNAFESVLMRWMNLEPITQSEVNQKEKDKYCILTHMYGTQKDGIDEPICRAAMETQTQGTALWTQWGKEGVDKSREQYGNIHITKCKVGSQREFAV